MKRSALITLLLLVGYSLPMSAQAVGKVVEYDPSKEANYTCSIIDITEINLGTPAIQLIFSLNGRRHCTVVGTKAFLEKNKFTFAKGETVQIVGVVLGEVEDGIFISTRLVKKGDVTLALKNEKGDPLWTPKH
jgi:hypothetical protein